jgi:hypothetical protein
MTHGLTEKQLALRQRFSPLAASNTAANRRRTEPGLQYLVDVFAALAWALAATEAKVQRDGAVHEGGISCGFLVVAVVERPGERASLAGNVEMKRNDRSVQVDGGIVAAVDGICSERGAGVEDEDREAGDTAGKNSHGKIPFKVWLSVCRARFCCQGMKSAPSLEISRTRPCK